MSSVELSYKTGTQTPADMQRQKAASNRKLGVIIALVTVVIAASVIFYRKFLG